MIYERVDTISGKRASNIRDNSVFRHCSFATLHSYCIMMMMRHHSYCVLTSYEFKCNPFVNSSSLLLERSPRNNTTQCNTIQYNTLQYRGTVQADGVGQDRRTVPPRCRAHARLLGGAGCAQRLHLSPEQTLSILPDTR